MGKYTNWTKRWWDSQPHRPPTSSEFCSRLSCAEMKILFLPRRDGQQTHSRCKLEVNLQKSETSFQHPWCRICLYLDYVLNILNVFLLRCSHSQRISSNKQTNRLCDKIRCCSMFYDAPPLTQTIRYVTAALLCYVKLATPQSGIVAFGASGLWSHQMSLWCRGQLCLSMLDTTMLFRII